MPAQSILSKKTQIKQKNKAEILNRLKINVKLVLHGLHVVLWLQRDLQDFGAVDNFLITRGGDSFPGDAVDLVEGVRFEDALVSRADEDLQTERFLASVAVKLQERMITDFCFKVF